MARGTVGVFTTVATDMALPSEQSWKVFQLPFVNKKSPCQSLSALVSSPCQPLSVLVSAYQPLSAALVSLRQPLQALVSLCQPLSALFSRVRGGGGGGVQLMQRGGPERGVGQPLYSLSPRGNLP